jgi:hypothetical protein
MASRKKSSANFDKLRKAFGLKRYTRTQYKNHVQKLIDLHLLKPGYDVTKAPTKYIQNKLISLKDVLTGNAQVLHIPKKEHTFYKESGFRTQGGRHVIVPVPKNTKVKYAEPTPEGMPQFTTHQKGRGGGTRTGRRTIVPYASLKEYLKDQVANAGPLQQGERYAFRFKGASSYGTFTTAQQMLWTLEKYELLEESNQEEEYESIEVFKTTPSDHAKMRAEDTKLRNERSKIRVREWREKFKHHSERAAAMTEEQRLKREAQQKREKRAVESPAQKEQRLAKNREYKARRKQK